VKWKIIILIGGILAVAFLLFHSPNQKDLIHDVFKNQQNLESVIKSGQVTAQRLHLKAVGDREDQLKDYAFDAPISLSNDQIQKIKSLLQNPKSYGWGEDVSCLPDYVALFRFHSGQQTIRIAFCFKCKMFGVFEGEDDTKRPINGTYMFSPMRNEIVSFAKTIFPSDAEIQSLK